MTGLHEVTRAIRAAEREAGRPEGETRLIAVSKQQPDDRIRAVLDAGHRLFGENRVQEAAGRWPALREAFDGIELHLVGPLQTNKVGAALDLFDAIQTLDREKLAAKIADAVQSRGIAPPVLYIQINTGEEPQKAGIAPGEADGFIARCRDTYGFAPAGLMAIPPADEPPAPHFALLAQIAGRNGLTGLSMGMSGDFPLAIAHGATCVRVGSAIFGDRLPRQT